MSSRLSSLLVQDGLVTAKRVADAFQRQVIYGGTLDSNLLELKAVDEDDLIHYLGRADGMPTQPTGINGAGMPLPEVLEVFTKEIAERFHAVPTKLLPGGVLRVLVPDGVEISEFDELALCVQQRIEPWITLEFRFVEAMDKVYGTGTPSRYARLLARSNQVHQGRAWPPARPIDPLPRFGSLASLRLVPEPPPAPVIAKPPAPPVDEPTTLMVAPALSAENTASLQIAAAMAAGEHTATMAVPASGQAAEATPRLAAPAEAAVPETIAAIAVPPISAAPAAAEPTASMAVPPSAEPTASMAVPPSAEPTASMAVPPSAEPTATMAVPPSAEPTATMAVPPSAEPTAPIEIPPTAESTDRMTVPPEAIAAQAPAAPQLTERTLPATAGQSAAVSSAAEDRVAAQSVPEFLPTVIIDPNSLNIDRSAPMKIAPAAPAPAAAAGDAAPAPSGLDDLSVADWMSAAEWLSAANKVDALASARSPLPVVRPADQEAARPPAKPQVEVAAPAASAQPAQPPAQPESKPEPQLEPKPTAPPVSLVAPAVAAVEHAAAEPPAPIAAAAPVAAPVAVPIVEKTVQLTAPATPPQTKPQEPKPPQAAAPSRPTAAPAAEAGGRKKGKKGKDGKQPPARQPAPTPPAADQQRRPQAPVAATPQTPAQPPAPAVSATAAKPAAPAQGPQPSVSARLPAPEASATAAPPTTRPAPSAAMPVTPAAAGKSGPMPSVAARTPAAPPVAAARTADLAEPPHPGIPPSQPRPTEPGPKPELRPAASAAPSAASVPPKSAPERAAPVATPAQPAPSAAAPIAAAAPSQSAPARAAAPAEPAQPATPSLAAPSAAAAPSKSAPAPAAAPAELAPPPAAPSAAAAPSKSAPAPAAAPAEPAQPAVPLAAAAPTKAAAEQAAGTPSQPAQVEAPPAAHKAAARPARAPEPIPEPVNSGRLGEPILLKGAKPVAPTAAPVTAEPPAPASAVSPLPRVARPPRVATALDAGGFSPLSLEAARELTGTVEDRDAIFEALCRGARSRCAFAAVFTLHGEVAFGRVALLDDWLDRTQLGRIAVQLDRPSPFRTAAKERTAFHGSVGAEAASGDPLRALNRSVPVAAAVLPVLVRGRAVALLYLDDEGYELADAVLDELKPLLADVGQALLRVSQKSKTGGLGAEPEPSAIGEEMPAVETSAWRAPSVKSPRPQPAAPGESLTTPLPPSVPAAASPVPQAASEQPTVPLRVSPPAAAAKQPAAGAPAADSARPAVPDAIHFQPTVPVATGAKAAAQPSAPATSSAKSPPGKSDTRGGKPAEPAAPPVAAKEAAGKPTLAELIERASNLDETAIDQLLAGGSEAARAVVAALPGPLRSRDRQALGDPVGGPVYSRGPLLALALRMGQAAVEPMLARLADPATPSEARYYLTLCFAEAPVTTAIAPLAECLYHSDDTVRMAAVSALRNFPPSSELGGIISKLRGTIDASDGKQARFAVEALGELRVAAAVPQLINLLDHEDPALVDAVGRALQTITKQDFGRSRVRWTAWWRRRQDEPRLQWLLEGLIHPSAMLRSAAQDELTGLSGDVVGYRFDQPRRDREQARKRWAQWWQRRGYPVM